MLCDNCKKNKATTYLKQNINGEVTEIFLCEECAKKLGVSGGSFFKSFGGFGDFGGFDFFMPEPLRTMQIGTEKKCECGKTFRSIAETGLAGCEKCYDTFRDELAATLKKMHGTVRHKPRLSSPKTEEKNPENELSELRRKMTEAVKSENFEEAARLRDEIKAREGK